MLRGRCGPEKGPICDEIYNGISGSEQLRHFPGVSGGKKVADFLNHIGPSVAHSEVAAARANPAPRLEFRPVAGGKVAAYFEPNLTRVWYQSRSSIYNEKYNGESPLRPVRRGRPSCPAAA